MAVPDWFKSRRENCVVHNVPYMEFTDKRKRGLFYCPECRQDVIREQNESKRKAEEGSTGNV